jgi:hypothetical protein
VVSTPKEKHMSKSTGRVVASDGGKGQITAEQITDLGILHGVFRKEDRAAVVARANENPGGVLSVVCAGLRPARAVTPATPATAASGPAVAAASRPTVDYPGSWAGSVDAARRLPGLRTAATKVARAAARRVAGQVHVAGAGPAFAAQARATAERIAQQAQASTHNRFYDKSVKPSAQAAAQQAAYDAELARMANEQRSRDIG